ncbi:MAG: hypothetical protein ACYTFO_10050, partial [Planctomycetota bacterium]
YRVVDDEEELLYEYDWPGTPFSHISCVLSDDGQALVSLPTSSDEPNALLVVYGPEGEVGSIMLADLVGGSPEDIQQFIDARAETGGPHDFVGRVGVQTFQWAERFAVFTDHDERLRLGVWLIEAGPWRDRWVCLDTEGVFAVEPDETLRPQLDAVAGERARGVIAEGNGDVMDAVRYLGAQRQWEDRSILEGVLVSAECSHSQSMSVMNGVVEFIGSRSYSAIRMEVDRLLSQWDGLDNSAAEGDQEDFPAMVTYNRRDRHCNFLGRIETAVELPRPLGSSRSAIRVYLVPESVTPAEWAPAMSQRVVDFYAIAFREGDDSTRIDFVLETVPPGRYWIQAVWDQGASRLVRPGQMAAGDYVGQSPVFEVAAAQTIPFPAVACDTQVTEAMAAEYAQRQQAAEEAPEGSENAQADE